MDNTSDPAYWSALYQANDTGWDKGRCAPPVARLLREGLLRSGAHLAVIGCGRGHEAFEAAALGFQVTAVDFAPEAISAVRERAKATGLPVAAVQADIFELAQRWPQQFDGIVEHTCLCAIDPQRRSEYVEAVSGALHRQGILLGLFYAHNRPDSPPYAIGEAEVRALLAARFDLERLVIAADSFENRAGQELEFVARRLD